MGASSRRGGKQPVYGPGAALVIAAVLSLALAGCHRSRGRTAPEAAAWQPPGPLLAQLGPEVSVPDFRIRPPAGFGQRQTSQGPNHGYAWVGPPRPDGTRATVAVAVLKPPPNLGPMPSAARTLQGAVAAIGRRRRGFRSEPPERGILGGVEFARTRWTGTIPETGKLARGIVYAGVDGRRMFQLTTQDLEGYHQAALPLGEASLLTFKPR